MLTRPQQILLKRAQRQAGIEDAEYRETMESLCHVRSSTDPRLADEDLDKMLAYFEAVFWRGVDAGRLQPSCKPNEPFQKRGFWKARNCAGNTSRDRHSYSDLSIRIEAFEADLALLGYGPDYCQAIREKVTHGRDDVRALHHYRVALERTLSAKRRRVEQPF
jgi:hypothetical protein